LSSVAFKAKEGNHSHYNFCNIFVDITLGEDPLLR
jgi:hypothetical protein